jgi:hypothetical protein
MYTSCPRTARIGLSRWAALLELAITTDQFAPKLVDLATTMSALLFCIHEA